MEKLLLVIAKFTKLATRWIDGNLVGELTLRINISQGGVTDYKMSIGGKDLE